MPPPRLLLLRFKYNIFEQSPNCLGITPLRLFAARSR
uniref:Uncharacterized protein n=1 Tax=Rhizophora mucronata TaxID=61149 RepID=A0A2P2QSF9_RHIMU